MQKYKVSKYNNVEDNYSKDYDLDTWLYQTINPPLTLRKRVDKYRSTLNKLDKEKLPLITVSSNFKGVRNLDNINKHLPFICIDIDRYSKRGKSNLCIDMQLVKELFMSHPSCYFCGYSVTLGDGIYAIMKLDEVGKLDKYFKMLTDNLSKVGINIDEKCKDATRLRFFSYDPEAYYNPEAIGLKLPVVTQAKEYNVVYAQDDYSKVLGLVDKIEHHSLDITQDYNDWIKIGAVLNNNFGESGRDLFHRISKIHPDYTVEKCNNKYNHCRKMRVSNIGLIVNLCKHYGLIN